MILGEAGTGKSTLINRIMNESNKRIAVCSFTGIASEQLQNARTIHSLFRLPPKDIYTSDMARAVSSLRKIDTLILDEISMVKIDLFELIIKSIHLTESKFNHKIQVIIAGDLSQLAPFVTSDSKKEFERLFQKRIYMYESDLFEQEHFERIVLKKIYRQKEPVFMDILRRIRFCESSAIDELYTMFDVAEHKEGIYLCARNIDVDRINAERAAESAYKASEKAIFVTEKGKTLLFAGMPIMTTVNRADFKNGSMGVIVSTHKGKYLIVKLNNGNTVNVYKDSESSIILVDPAFAMSINKSQGLTIKGHINILCDQDMRAPKMLYVAMSRATDMNNVHLVNNKLTVKTLKPSKRYIEALNYLLG